MRSRCPTLEGNERLTLTMADFGPHTALLLTQFTATLASFLDSHTALRIRNEVFEVSPSAAERRAARERSFLSGRGETRIVAG
jgi:hypothetical protein